MEPSGILILVAIVVVPLFVVLEGWRQRRRMEERGEEVKPFSGGDLAGAGLLELQGLLQPDRKVEIILKKEDAHHQEADPGGSGL